MKTLQKILAIALTLVLCLGMIPAAHAATVAEATIDTTKTASMTIYKYDITNAEKDGVWDGSYVSTGVYDQTVNDTLGGATRAGDTDAESALGNGDTSNGYAVKGVEFTYLKVAEICQYSKADATGSNLTKVLYGIDNAKATGLLAAIGLTAENRYQDADVAGEDILYFESDVLVNALRTALNTNATTVKNALEVYVKGNGGTAMQETDANGMTAAADLPLGLYLVVETKVPEMVTNTTNPFFLSLPMTSVNGNNATNGGQEWLYDVTLYPKNETGIPTLEKTVREAKADTGKNEASGAITDGFAHNVTGSAADVMEYQIVSTLPSITSDATALAAYTFVDTLSKGLTYVKGDVVLEWYTDSACTDKITAWTEDSGKFSVSYDEQGADKDAIMTITMTADGLAEINTANTVYTEASEIRQGYSDCTVRITYTAKLDSDNTVVFGDSGNPNEVILTWKRTSSSYYDTLNDDCHVYTYGIDLTKTFSDGKGDFSKVQFVLYNATDKYWVQAALNEAEGIYYVTGHLAGERDVEAEGRTLFVPVTSAGQAGKIIVKGLEDDTYILTEVQTDNGYTLLKNSIEIVISQQETEALCDVYTTQDGLGLLQNDPRYATVLNAAGVDTALGLHNMPQRHLDHHLLTASATVDGNAVAMLTDTGSVNAIAPLRVVNTHGYDLPGTGELSARWLPLVGAGVCGLGLCALILLLCTKKRKETN